MCTFSLCQNTETEEYFVKASEERSASFLYQCKKNAYLFIYLCHRMFSPLRCLQLAKAGSHVFADRSFKRRRACDVCKQNIDIPGAFCKGESASPRQLRRQSRRKKKKKEPQVTSMRTHLDLTARSWALQC